MNDNEPFCFCFLMFFLFFLSIILSEVPPNCTQRAEGPFNAAGSLNFFFVGYWHDGGMATEVAVHFLTAADHFDSVQSVKH